MYPYIYISIYIYPYIYIHIYLSINIYLRTSEWCTARPRRCPRSACLARRGLAARAAAAEGTVCPVPCRRGRPQLARAGPPTRAQGPP